MASQNADVPQESRPGRLRKLLSPRRLFWLVIASMVLVVLLGLGTVAIYKMSVDAQLARIAKVDALGGQLVRDSGNNARWAPDDLLGAEWEPPPVKALLVDSPLGPRFPALVEEARHFRGLEGIWLNGTSLSDAQLQALVNRGRLTQLFIAGTDVTDEGLKSLTTCSKLEVLDLRLTPITDRGLESLARIKSLTRIDLRHTQVGSSAAARLQAELPNARIWHYSVPSQEHWKVLRDIGRRGGLWQDHGLQDGLAEGVPVAISIDPDGNWSGFDWKSLRAVQGLDSLYLESQPVAAAVLADVRDAREVKWLAFKKVTVDDRVIEQLKRTVNLNSLWMEECQFSGAPPSEWLPGFNHLTSLNIKAVRIDAQLLAAVTSLPKLMHVTLDHCQFENQVLASAALPSQLESLSLSNSNLDDDGIKAIAQCRNLKFVDISNSKVTDASLDLILSLPKLEAAHSYGSSMSQAAMDKVDAGLQAHAAKAAGGNTPPTNPP